MSPQFTPPPEWMVRQPDTIDKLNQTAGILGDYAKSRRDDRKMRIEEAKAKRSSLIDDIELQLKNNQLKPKKVMTRSAALAAGEVPHGTEIVKDDGPDGPTASGGSTASEAPPPPSRTFQKLGEEIHNGKKYIRVMDTRTGRDALVLSESQGETQPFIRPAISGSSVEALAKLSAIGKKAEEINNNYSSDFVGPLDSLVGKAQQFTGLGATEQQGYFRSLLTGISDDLLRAKSGAQINEQEYKRLMGYLPNASTSDVDFGARMKAFQFELNAIMESKQSVMGGAGYRNVEGAIQGATGQPMVSSAPAGNAGGKPKTLMQNGHTYTLNEQTGRYE